MCDIILNTLSNYLKYIGCIGTDKSDKTDTSKITNPHDIDINIDINLLSNETKFNLLGIKGNFYVKSVYDGDTITLQVPINLSVFNFLSENKINSSSINNPENHISLYEIRVRLLGIDTPEMKPSKTLPNREEHIEKAKKAKDFLSSLILNQIITVEFKENDKYGRPLVILYSNDININNQMIDKGFAKSYDGGTKETNF
jgi:endonuclease YncB( thermonuclease family)